jgi:hypothetical protein
MRIWKYPLEITDTQVIKVPQNSTILTLQMQNQMPVMWVLVDIDADLEDRTFNIYGTGHALPQDYGTGHALPQDYGTYRGTFQKGGFVGHVFEL